MDAKMGIGGAPTRATTFATTAEGRKNQPVASGVLDYFPDAIVAIAAVSKAGNYQHSPGQPLNWARDKSGDEADALLRHFLQRGTVDDDGLLHSAKLAWRALALLQKEIEGSVVSAVVDVGDKYYEGNHNMVDGFPVMFRVNYAGQCFWCHSGPVSVNLLKFDHREITKESYDAWQEKRGYTGMDV